MTCKCTSLFIRHNGLHDGCRNWQVTFMYEMLIIANAMFQILRGCREGGWPCFVESLFCYTFYFHGGWLLFIAVDHPGMWTFCYRIWSCWNIVGTPKNMLHIFLERHSIPSIPSITCMWTELALNYMYIFLYYSTINNSTSTFYRVAFISLSRKGKIFYFWPSAY